MDEWNELNLNETEFQVHDEKRKHWYGKCNKGSSEIRQSDNKWWKQQINYIDKAFYLKKEEAKLHETKLESLYKVMTLFLCLSIHICNVHYANQTIIVDYKSHRKRYFC